MPCQDSSSGINFRVDANDRFISFEFAKITCSSAIGGNTGLSNFCAGKSLEEILTFDFRMLVSAFGFNSDEEMQFILCLELDALKAAIVQYLGIDVPGVDVDRCKIISIDVHESYTEVSLLILPPTELPKILPCSSHDHDG